MDSKAARVQDTERLQLAPHTVLRRGDGQAPLLQLGATAASVCLNEAAARLLAQCDGTRTVAAITRAHPEALEFLGVALRLGWLVPRRDARR